MAVMVDIRVEGANLRSGSCLVSQNGSSRSLPGGLAPVSAATDAGVFRVVGDQPSRLAEWIIRSESKAGLKLVRGQKQKALLTGVASRASEGKRVFGS
jgi:hypothetical protein